MKNLGRVIRIAIIMMAVATFLGPGGCAKSVDQVRKPLPDIRWPEPPEKSRIQFVNSVSKPEDILIKPGLFKRFFRYLIGKEDASMVAPYGVETDASGRLYVADTFLRTVHVFDVRKNVYYPFPAGEAKFVSPIDVAIDDARGNIYVSDSKLGTIKVFERAGKKLVGEIGKEILQRPTGITVNEKTSELLVVDTQSGHVFKYDLNDQRLKGRFGGSGTADGKLNYPTNICVGEDGIILVSDSLNFRVQLFSPEGRFLGKFGSIGDSPGYFSRPRGVAVDSDGNIYVVDGLFDNVQVFDKEFRLLMAFGGPGHGYGEFWLPSGIYIDKDDLIYISDSHNKRVQIFQYLKGDASSTK